MEEQFLYTKRLKHLGEGKKDKHPFCNENGL